MKLAGATPSRMHRKEAVSQSLTALVNGDADGAVMVSSSYYGGAGTLYEKETVEIIRCILENEYTPDAAIKLKVLKPLRVVAAAMELWGASEVQEFAEVSGDWTYRLSPRDVTQLLYTAGLEQHRLRRLQECGVKEVAVRTRNKKPAPACREVLGKIFPIAEAPSLPHGDPACQCSYAAAPQDHQE